MTETIMDVIRADLELARVIKDTMDVRKDSDGRLNEVERRDMMERWTRAVDRVDGMLDAMYPESGGDR